MSLDSRPVRLTKTGTVTVLPVAEGNVPVQIIVEGFEAPGGTCRDVAVLACLWAIGELQREVLRTVEEAGTGSIGLD